MYDYIVHRMLHIAHTLHAVVDPSSKKAHTTFVFIHGIGSSRNMWRKTIANLRNRAAFDGVSCISLDLLGFGKSPKPTWVDYSATRQARSVHRTLRSKAGANTKLVLIGHSLGALVAVEYAKKYPYAVDELVLCGPPFYRQRIGKLPSKAKLLQKMYHEFAKNPERSERLLLMAQKYTLVNEGYSIDESNAPIFIRTLKSSIMNQTAYDDARALTIPTTILAGMLDPVVIEANITSLAKHNKHIRQKRIALAAHEITAIYRKELVKTLAHIVRE